MNGPGQTGFHASLMTYFRPSCSRLAVLAVLVLTSCASVEKGRYGVDSLDFEGVNEMDEDPLAACLVTRERESFRLKLGLSSAVCNEPPFDSSAPSVRLWRFPWAEWPIFNNAVFDRDLERIRRWYRARGFYEAKVTGVRVEPEAALHPGRVGECDPDKEQCEVQIVVSIDEGRPVRTRAISVRGDDDLEPALKRRLRTDLPLEPGEPFDEALYDAGKKKLRDALRAASYAGANVNGTVHVETGTRVATVEYRVEPGPRYTFGRLRVSGNKHLPRKPIEAAAGIRAGEPYDPEVLAEAQAEVFALGAFSGVDIEESLDEKNRRADIDLRVTPLGPEELRLGIGVLSGANRRTDTGELTSIPQWDTHLFGSYERRHIFGTLGRFRVDEKPRLIFSREFPRFTTPQFGNVVGVGVNQPGLLEARTDSFARSEWDYGPDPFLGFTRSDVFVRLGARRGYFSRHLIVTLALQQDLFVVPSSGDNVTSDGSPRPSSYTFSYLEEDVRLDLRDDSVRPRHGFYLGVNTTQAPRWTLSDWTAFRVGPDIRGYVPLPLDVVLAMRFAPTALFIVDAASDLDPLSRRLGPTAYRLRGGGAYGNRGFLAGRLGAGLQGGLRRWESSVELRIPFGDSLALGGFADFGDVNDRTSFRFDHLNTSLGLGIRYFTIIGAIRADAGFRIARWQRADGSDGIEADADTFPFTSAPGALHLTIGESF